MQEENINLPKQNHWPGLWVILSFLILIAVIILVYYFVVKPNKNSSQFASQSTTPSTSVSLAFDQEETTKDMFLDPNGPYYHKVYKAVSDDGLSFTKTGGVILDKASVPDVIKMPDGRLFIYAVDGGMRSKSVLMVAISSDNGETWQQGSLQLKNSQGKTIAGGADPEIILLPDGKLRLFYVVFPEKKSSLDETGKPISTGGKTSINSAISSDGVNFQEEEGRRYQSTETITDPDIIKINDKWYMYLSIGPKLIAVSSSDGLNFSGEEIIRQQGSVSKTVAIGDSKYRQFYCKSGIASATSTDGLSWQDDSGLRLTGDQGQTICDPAPVKLDNQWLLFYKVGSASGTTNQPAGQVQPSTN